MGDIRNSRVNIGPELDNNGFCFDMANNYYQLAKCRRIQENITHLVLLKEYICNTGERSRIKRIVRLYSSRNCIDPLVDALNFLRCVEKLHLQVCACKVYPLSQLIQFVFIRQFQNTHLPYSALTVSINWLMLTAPGKRFSSFSNTM